MSLKKQIQALIALFVVLLLGFGITAALLFKKNFEYFDTAINDKAKEHLHVLKILSQVETSLYVFNQSFQCAATTAEDQCFLNMKEAQETAMERFKSLEIFNKEHFEPWIVVDDFESRDPAHELQDTLVNFQEASKNQDRNDRAFQRLFYLVRASSIQFFRVANEHVNQQMKNPDGNIATPDAVSQKPLEFLYLGVDQIKEYYNRVFWDNSRKQNSRFVKNTRHYYYAVIGACALLFLFAIGLAMLINKHFRSQQQRDEKLVLLGTRDLVTGLFNKRSLEALVGQELQRAKRRSYTLSLLILRVEPYDQMKTELGQIALDRLFFQISEILKNSCRGYDSIFKLDKKSFVIVFPEADPKIINSLVNRFNKKLGRKRFLVKADQTKATPVILMGAAGYPLNGNDYRDLLGFAEATLSENFDARIIHEQMDGIVKEAQSLEPKPDSVLDQMQATPESLPVETQAPETKTEETPSLENKPADDDFTFVPPGATEPQPALSVAVTDDFTFVPPGATEPQPLPKAVAENETQLTASEVPPAEDLTSPPAQTDQPAATPKTAEAANPVDDFTFVPPGATEPVPIKTLETSPAPEPTPAVPAAKEDDFTFVPPGATEPAPNPTLNAPDEIPDVVSALSQEESASLAPKPEAPILTVVEPQAPESETQDNGIAVVAGDKEDVIMVDFDRERQDLTEKMRQRKNPNPQT